MKTRCVQTLLLGALLLPGCFLGTANRSRQELAEETATARATCQSGNDDACSSYIADQYIASHCAFGNQPGAQTGLGALIILTTGTWNLIGTDCAQRVRQIVTVYAACQHGDKASCADIDVAVSQAQERQAAAQAASERSALAAQWAQAQALSAQARAAQQQTRQLQLQSLPRLTTTNCTPTGLGGVSCTQF